MEMDQKYSNYVLILGLTQPLVRKVFNSYKGHKYIWNLTRCFISYFSLPNVTSARRLEVAKKNALVGGDDVWWLLMTLDYDSWFWLLILPLDFDS